MADVSECISKLVATGAIAIPAQNICGFLKLPS